MLDLQWSIPRTSDDDLYIYDRAFRSLWFLALGWALAEVCAGIVQGFEQLALYDDVESALDASGRGLTTFGTLRGSDGVTIPFTAEPFEESSPEGIGLGLKLKVANISKRVAEESLEHAIPCVENDPDDPDFKAGPQLNNLYDRDDEDLEHQDAFDIDAAITHFTNVKAREDLEMIYGAPFVQIPVFVTVLQRVDSVLLSLGMTLTMGFAYLCDRSFAMGNSIGPLHRQTFASRTSTANEHWHALVPTFVVLTLIHVFLGVLHTPGVLSRIGVHVAAYIACLVGLGLVFAGMGMWVDLW